MGKRIRVNKYSIPDVFEVIENVDEILVQNLDHIAFTGERLVLNQNVKQNYRTCMNGHLLNYKFASEFVKGKSVLDAACGSGYGTKMLELAGAARVTGIDISEEAVINAMQIYKGERSEFITADIHKLPFVDKSYDIIISFETIEHIDDGAIWLQESARVLKDDGILIISSPNREVTEPGLYFDEQPTNPYHKHEYNIGEFVGELLAEYDLLELYGQGFRHEYHHLITKALRRMIKRKDVEYLPSYIPRECKVEYNKLIAMRLLKDAKPMGLVAVCKKKSINY